MGKIVVKVLKSRDGMSEELKKLLDTMTVDSEGTSIYCGDILSVEEVEDAKVLKGCPFCGSEAYVVKEQDAYERTYGASSDDTFCYGVECVRCNGKLSAVYETEEAAVDAWNGRK